MKFISALKGIGKISASSTAKILLSNRILKVFMAYVLVHFIFFTEQKTFLYDFTKTNTQSEPYTKK